jgi:hypothetical protein
MSSQMDEVRYVADCCSRQQIPRPFSVGSVEITTPGAEVSRVRFLLGPHPHRLEPVAKKMWAKHCHIGRLPYITILRTSPELADILIDLSDTDLALYGSAFREAPDDAPLEEAKRIVSKYPRPQLVSGTFIVLTGVPQSEAVAVLASLVSLATPAFDGAAYGYYP